MNPNAGEGGSNQPSITPAAPTAGPDVAAPADPSLNNLEGVVKAAQDAVGAQAAAAPTLPQTPEQAAFVGQFDPTQSTMPAAEPAPDLMSQAISSLETPSDQSSSPVAQLDPNIKTVDDLLTKGPQVVDSTGVETTPGQETPAEKLKKKIADSVDAFLEEVTKEKVSA